MKRLIASIVAVIASLTILFVTGPFNAEASGGKPISAQGGGPADFPPIELHLGWNWVAYPLLVPQDLPQALWSISGKYDYVLGETGTYAPPPANQVLNNLSRMESGKGYMIRMKEAGVLLYTLPMLTPVVPPTSTNTPVPQTNTPVPPTATSTLTVTSIPTTTFEFQVYPYPQNQPTVVGGRLLLSLVRQTPYSKRADYTLTIPPGIKLHTLECEAGLGCTNTGYFSANGPSTEGINLYPVILTAGEKTFSIEFREEGLAPIRFTRTITVPTTSTATTTATQVPNSNTLLGQTKKVPSATPSPTKLP